MYGLLIFLFSILSNASDLASLKAMNNAVYAVHVKETSKDSHIQNRLACYGMQASELCQLRIYEIMVESFVDGDPKANFKIGYGPSSHHGDIQGVINSLDYIKSLGMNGIWLTPIFLSGPVPSDDPLDATGYFASDYFKIDPRFGSLDQAKNLVLQAHKRGLYVFFDGVFGHHKEKIVAAPSGLLPIGNNYQVDYSKPETLKFYQEVASYWINELKIDGWRLDQAYQVPLSAWSEISRTVKSTSAKVTYQDSHGQSVHPLGYMVAEVVKKPKNISQDIYGDNSAPVLSSAFDFPMRKRLVQTLACDEGGLRLSSALNLAAGFEDYTAYPDHAMPNLILGNHDFVRFGDLIKRAKLATTDGDEYWARHKAAFAFLANYSGPITFYYNEEIGQEVANFSAKITDNCWTKNLCDEMISRTTGIVEGVAGPDLNPKQRDLKNYFQSLMRLRAANLSLSSGSRTQIYVDQNLYIDRKDHGKNSTLFFLNIAQRPAKVTLNSGVLGSKPIKLQDMLSKELFTENVAGEFIIPVSPISARFLEIIF